MNARSLALESGQALEVLRVGGDLVVQGWDRPEVEARGDGVQIERVESGVRVSSRGDLEISVLRDARLEIRTVGGDARVQDLAGPVSFSVIGGDLELRNLAGPTSINGPVGGDTRFENVAQVSVAGGGIGLGGHISDRVERATERAQRSVERQQRRTEDRLRQAEKKVERVRARTGVDLGRWLWRRRGGTIGGDPSNEPVSADERMAILRMLQDKKITSAEADQLLAALEGEQGSPEQGGSTTEAAER